jgi:hypothetical protein
VIIFILVGAPVAKLAGIILLSWIRVYNMRMETWMFVVVLYTGFVNAPDPIVSTTYYAEKENCLARMVEFKEYSKDKPEYIWFNCVRKPYEASKGNDADGSVRTPVPGVNGKKRPATVSRIPLHGLASEWPGNVQPRGGTGFGERAGGGTAEDLD